MDQQWITNVVSTKGRPCPYRLADPCPGTRDGCAFWIHEILTNSEGKAAAQEGCLIGFQYVMTHGVMLEQIRASASADKVANVVARVGVGLQRSMLEARDGRDLHGGLRNGEKQALQSGKEE